MQKTKLFTSTLCVAVAAVLGTINGHAQTAFWTGATDNDWNNANNWDVLTVPGVTTNAIIGSSVTVSYASPMVAPSFASLDLYGSLTVNANAFTMDVGGLGTAPVNVEGGGILTVGANGVVTGTNGGPLTIASGGLMSVAGTALFSPASGAALTLNGGLNVAGGGALTINGGTAISLPSSASFTNSGTTTINNMGSITLTDVATPVSELFFEPGSTFTMAGTTTTDGIVVGSGTSTSAGAIMTVEGGTVTLDKVLTVKSAGRVNVTSGTLNCQGGSRINNTGNDGSGRFQIDNGTVNLGNFFIYRTTSSGGLIVNNGVVNATAMQIGTGNSTAYATINGGIVTNTGVFTICDNNVVNSTSSTDRRQRLLIRGGTVVSTGSGGIVVGNQSQLAANTSSRIGGILDINSGSLTAEGITLLKDNTIINNWGIFNLSGSGVVYLGSVGLTGNTGPSSSGYVISFSGGTLGAKADYAINANTPITGTMTFKAADAAGTAHNITHNGNVTSSGALTKTGNGILTLNGVNSYSGATTISAGTLALGPSATLTATPQINVAAGATFNVSAPGGFTLASGKLLGGSGTVAGVLTAAAGSSITVGDTVGTLSFSSGLTLGNNVVVNFEISPSTNDLVEIGGNLDVSGGTTTVSVTALGGSLAAGTYTLFHYGGSLIGDISHFSLVGAPGYLTNNTTAQAIQLVTTGLRAPSNVVWVGNASANDWDVLNHTNWVNGATLDSFVQGDTVLFDTTGAANPSVNITAPVNPAAVTVDAATDYTFNGAGAIGGSGGLTKTNTGTLVVMTTNSYTGPTVIGQGTLEVIQLANGGANSGIGAANNSANNLAFYGGTLKYSGGSMSTDRGATLNNTGGTINITNSSTVLTDSGTLTGSGGLTKSGPGSLVLSAANNYAGGTVVSNGVLQINAATSAGSSVITNIAGSFRVNGALVVDNAMEFDGNSALEFNGVGSGNVALRGAWSGGGTVNVSFLTQNSSQTFSIGGEGAGGGTMTAFSGTVNFGTNSGSVRLNNNSTFNLGSPNATFNLGTGTVSFSQRNGNTTTDLGALIGGPNTKLTGSRSDVHGLETYSIGGNNLSTTFAGTITNGTGTSADTTAITKVGTGMFTLSGTNYYTSATTVNDGELRVDGAILNSAVTVNSGTLSGSGTFGQSVTVYGTLAPGDSGIGSLTVNANLSLNGATIMEVDKGAGTNDLVTGINNLYYNGTLLVTNLSGTLTNGTVFKLFSAQTYNGDFYGGITLPELAPGLTWQTNLTVDGTIRIPPLTNSPVLVSMISGSTLTLSWPATQTGWTLEVQTNNLATGLTGNWTPVPNSDLQNSYSATIDPANETVFYRLTYTP